jgi:hypothetical protein
VQDCVSQEPVFHPGTPVGDLIGVLLDEIGSRNLTAVVDLHTTGGEITPFPWTESVSEDEVVAAWLNFLGRFGSHPALYAIELKNEPHSGCTLSQFLDHCAYLIHNIDQTVPEYQGLFFTSGVQLNGSAWGGSYEKIALESVSFVGLSHPSSLCAINVSTDRFVFVPRVYGVDVRGAGAEYDNEETWTSAYGFITTFDGHWNQTAIVVTECGGYTWEGSSDLDYFRRWLAWTKSKNLTAGGYIWTLGPYSRDTGGILNPDYSVRWDKIDFAKQLAGSLSQV